MNNYTSELMRVLDERGYIHQVTDAAGLDAVFVGDGRRLVRLVGEHDLVATDLGTGRIDQNDGSVTFGGSPAIDPAGSVAFAATLSPGRRRPDRVGHRGLRGPGDARGRSGRRGR